MIATPTRPRHGPPQTSKPPVREIDIGSARLSPDHVYGRDDVLGFMPSPPVDLQKSFRWMPGDRDEARRQLARARELGIEPEWAHRVLTADEILDERIEAALTRIARLERVVEALVNQGAA